jgi:hypothetical protein
MQFEPSEQPDPLPFIRLADASDEMIGAGIERAKTAKATAAIAGKTNFMIDFLSGIAMSLS